MRSAGYLEWDQSWFKRCQMIGVPKDVCICLLFSTKESSTFCPMCLTHQVRPRSFAELVNCPWGDPPTRWFAVQRHVIAARVLPWAKRFLGCQRAPPVRTCSWSLLQLVIGHGSGILFTSGCLFFFCFSRLGFEGLLDGITSDCDFGTVHRLSTWLGNLGWFEIHPWCWRSRCDHRSQEHRLHWDPRFPACA